MIEPTLDGAAIQGDILPGFHRRQQWLVAVAAGDEGALRAALACLSEQVTSVADVLRHRAKVSALRASGVADDALPDPLWLNVALGREGLELLGEGGLADVDDAFKDGMVASRTGDPDAAKLPNGSANPAMADNWVVGGPNRAFHLLLNFAADAGVKLAAAPLWQALLAIPGITLVYEELGQLLPDGTEHFGFVDGISVPGVFGQVIVDGAATPITRRYGVPTRDGVHFGKPGQPLVWPGRFIVGAPRRENDHGEAVSDLARNGSLLVFRRLAQDVAAFYADTIEIAAQMAEKLGDPSLDGARLRALFVGRWPSGQPLMRAGHAPPDAPEPEIAMNHFGYLSAAPNLTLDDGTTITGAPGDLKGMVCPMWAHIRKVNPRDVASDQPEAPRDNQLLRRGIPFGPAFDHGAPHSAENKQPRGLLFLAYQRAIDRQFEVLNSDWMNSLDLPVAGTGGFDILVGQHLQAGLHAPREFQRLTDKGPTPFVAPRHWVTPTGGAYLFAPSIPAIKQLAQPQAPPPTLPNPTRAAPGVTS